MDNRKIGVFDSGIGGLTCLSDLVEKFPHEDFLYLADNLNCPYGTKTKAELEQIVSNIIKYFELQDVKAIIIACNTATANSYHIKSKVPIIRIIEPTAQIANTISSNIGLLATNFTVSSKVYERYITGNVTGVPCSEFVGLVEEGLMGTETAFKIVEEKLYSLIGKVDTVILGCTHFGLLTEEIKACLGNINIVDSSLSVAPILKGILEDKASSAKKGSIEILVTKDEMLNIKWFNKPYQSMKLVRINNY